MYKRVTLNFVIVFLMYVVSACKTEVADEADIEFLKQLDSISAAKIDSISTAVQQSCDSTAQQKITIIVDSLIHADSLDR